MSGKKSSVADTLFFGFGLIIDIVIITVALFKECFGPKK